MRLSSGSLLALLAWVVLAPSAAAEPLLQQKLPLGAPPRSLSVTLEENPQGEDDWLLRVGKTRITLPWEAVSAPKAESIVLPGGGAVLRVLAHTATGETQALVGGRRARRLLWQGPVGLRGDPGEREGTELLLEPVEGGTRIELRRRAEALALCGGAPVWLSSRRVDPETLLLVRSPLPELGTSVTVEAKPLPSLTSPSALRVLRPTGTVDPSGQASLFPPPRLDDGERDTAVRVEPRAPRLFVRAHLESGGFPVQRLELAAPPAPARLPRTLVVELGDARRIRVKLDPKAETQVVELAEPLAPHCLTLSAKGPFGRPTGIGELRAVTELHGDDPAQTLARALAADGDHGGAAARMLARLGAEGARATLAVWPELSSLGRRRALGVLAPYLGEPAVLAVVREAAEDPALREPAVQVLARSEGPGREVLAALAEEDDGAGLLALRALGETAGNAELLLALLAAEGGADRPALREAVGEQARVDALGLEGHTTGWLPDAPVAARAALALAIAGRHPRLTPVAQAACQQAAFAEQAGFVERYRCALALAQLPASPEGDAWLANQSTQANEWMQRRVALRALRERRSPATLKAAEKALSDDTPRVRAEAAQALSGAGATAELRARAERDPWPDVRAAAVGALADDDALDLLERRVNDPSRQVRVAAIEALTEREHARAWPAVRKRLEHEREWPAVRAAAIRYAAALCIRDAEDALRAQLARGLGPEADSPDVAVAVDALRALRRLDGAVRAETERWLDAQGAPEALDRAAGDPPRCGAGKPPNS